MSSPLSFYDHGDNGVDIYDYTNAWSAKRLSQRASTPQYDPFEELALNPPAFLSADTANCVGTGDAAYPESNDYSYMRRLCLTCPLVRACLQYALDHHEQHGMWGGLTPNERRTVWQAAS